MSEERGLRVAGPASVVGHKHGTQRGHGPLNVLPVHGRRLEHPTPVAPPPGTVRDEHPRTTNHPRGGAVDPRTMSVTGNVKSIAPGPSPCNCWTSSRALSTPSWRRGTRTVVSGGENSSANGMSLNPTMDISPGQCRPRARKERRAPRAMRSLPVTTAVGRDPASVEASRSASMISCPPSGVNGPQ
jgi:hypothetical protein